MCRSVYLIFSCLLVFYPVTISGNSKDNNYQLFPQLPDFIESSPNILCRDQSRAYFENLKNLSLWAHEMQDATAKSTFGILTGSFQKFGQFHECLAAQAPFPTQYCLAAVTAHVPDPDPPRNPKSLEYDPNESVLRKVYDYKDISQQTKNTALLGWCIPASCTPQDLEKYLNDYLAQIDFHLKSKNVTFSANIDPKLCQKDDERLYLDHLDISFCLTLVIVICLVTFSTIMYTWRKEKKSSEETPVQKLLVAFSIQKNFSKLKQFDETSNSALNVLYGMRVFAILMIIMDHRFGTHLSSGILNFNDVENLYRNTGCSIFFHGDIFVDSFFILSGLLVTYCLLLQYDKKFINPAFVVLLRYIRLTPVYAFVIFYCATLFNYTGAGPMWKAIVTPEVQDCRTNWWTNLLYINNYVNQDHMCMVQSWFLPCDFHFFLIAVLLCFLISRNKRIGLIVLFATTIISIVIPFVTTYVNENAAVLYFYPTFLRAPKAYPDFLNYIKSHSRAATYFIGMLAGYGFYKMKGCEKRIPKTLSHLLTGVSAILMISSIFTGIIFYSPDYKYNALEAAFYASLHRVAWGIGSVGILFAASYGHASFIREFLCWTPWVPLSKLVYGAYLIHFQFQMRAVGRKSTNTFESLFDIVSYSLSDMVLSFATALLLYLAIEAPVRNIFGILLSSPPKEKESKVENNNTIAPDNTCDSHL